MSRSPGFFTSAGWLIQHALSRCGQAVVHLLPRRVALGAGALLASLTWKILRKRTRIAEKEASRVVGERGAKVAAGSFQHLMRTIVSLTRAHKDREWFSKNIAFEGLEHLDKALAMGRGVIAVSGHFGYWEAFNIAMAARGHSVHVVRRAMDNPWMNADFERYWKRLGTNILWRAGATREGIRALKAGGIVTLYVDQDARRHGVFVPFLGLPASTIRGPAILSLKTGAPIVGYAVTRQGDGRSLVQIEEPFVADPALPTDEAVLQATRRLTEALERRILAAPEQWMWIHRRWKTKPSEVEPADAADAGEGDEGGPEA